ncbi:hypothetical protein [Microbacterium sp. 1P10AE]|uniref:hypothetical protein n=1 Tax=Microbacterium sp. 1P10AE TaxID=3132286 RepID=UPI00399F58CE
MNTPADRLPGADEENIVPESDGLAADVPAGGAGADTGAVGAASIDPDDDAHIQNVSSQNDVPGVGTRAGDDGAERGAGQHGATSRHHDDEAQPATEKTSSTSEGEDHVDADSLIAQYEPGVGRSSAESSKIAQSLPDRDDA